MRAYAYDIERLQFGMKLAGYEVDNAAAADWLIGKPLSENSGFFNGVKKMNIEQIISTVPDQEAHDHIRRQYQSDLQVLGEREGLNPRFDGAFLNC